MVDIYSLVRDDMLGKMHAMLPLSKNNVETRSNLENAIFNIFDNQVELENLACAWVVCNEDNNTQEVINSYSIVFDAYWKTTLGAEYHKLTGIYSPTGIKFKFNNYG